MHTLFYFQFINNDLNALSLSTDSESNLSSFNANFSNVGIISSKFVRLDGCHYHTQKKNQWDPRNYSVFFSGIFFKYHQKDYIIMVKKAKRVKKVKKVPKVKKVKNDKKNSWKSKQWNRWFMILEYSWILRIINLPYHLFN